MWFYRLGTNRLVNRRDYLGSISVIKLSATHAAVLSEGKVIVHPIEVRAGTELALLLVVCMCATVRSWLPHCSHHVYIVALSAVC